MKITVRAAECADASGITRLNREEMGYAYPEAEETLVGYVHANDYDLLYAPHMKNIMGIAVSSSFRRTGVGAGNRSLRGTAGVGRFPHGGARVLPRVRLRGNEGPEKL